MNNATSLSVPESLRSLPQWVLWKTVTRKGKPTKVPFQTSGVEAKSNDATTWTDFESVAAIAGKYSGVGFMFSPEDSFCGVDLDGCRDPETGEVAKWASSIIKSLDSYCEVSPSKTGVKIFVLGNMKGRKGRKTGLDFPKVCDKQPGLEVYERGRYFAVTGWKLEGVPDEPQERQEQLSALLAKHFPIRKASANGSHRNGPAAPGANGHTTAAELWERHRQRLPQAISGQGGHHSTYHAMCYLWRLTSDATQVHELADLWNATHTGDEQWSDSELNKKIEDARQEVEASGELGRYQRRSRTIVRESHDAAARSRNLTDPAERGEQRQSREPEPIKYERVTSAQLDATEYHIEYLIDGVLVAGQPCIVAGGKKNLKTSLIIDMAVSLSVGGFFLGKLPVSRACRVLVMSGESGLPTLQETARRIAKQAGHRLGNLDNLIWSPDLPRFGDLLHMDAFETCLMEDEIEVVFVDPAYMAMPGGDASNLFIQGALLQSATRICQRMGCTLVLAHHTKRGGRADLFAPPELEDIAWAGFQEWARQWLLLNRREKYEPGSGFHRLWLSVGGSAGHSSLWGLDIAEGVYNGQSERYWQVDMLKSEDVRDDAEGRRESAKVDKEAALLERNMKSILSAVLNCPGGRGTKTEIKERAGVSGNYFSRAWAELLKTKSILESGTVPRGNGQAYTAYEINHSDTRD